MPNFCSMAEICAGSRQSSSIQAITGYWEDWGDEEVEEELFYRTGTGVHLAVYVGLADITAALLEKGFLPDCRDSGGETPLLWLHRNDTRQWFDS